MLVRCSFFDEFFHVACSEGRALSHQQIPFPMLTRVLSAGFICAVLSAPVDAVKPVDGCFFLFKFVI